MKIRIISTPPGGAPEWVRKEWVGLELPTVESSGRPQVGATGGKPENLGGFQINGKVAIDALKEKSPEAAKWWEDNWP